MPPPVPPSPLGRSYSDRRESSFRRRALAPTAVPRSATARLEGVRVLGERPGGADRRPSGETAGPRTRWWGDGWDRPEAYREGSGSHRSWAPHGPHGLRPPVRGNMTGRIARAQPECRASEMKPRSPTVAVD